MTVLVTADDRSSISPLAEHLPIDIDDSTMQQHSDILLEAKPLQSNNNVTSKPHIPSISASAVLGESLEMPSGTPECRGHDFSISSNIEDIMNSFLTTGFQATNVGMAIKQIQEMRSWRLSSTIWKEGIDDESSREGELR